VTEDQKRFRAQVTAMMAPMLCQECLDRVQRVLGVNDDLLFDTVEQTKQDQERMEERAG